VLVGDSEPEICLLVRFEHRHKESEWAIWRITIDGAIEDDRVGELVVRAVLGLAIIRSARHLLALLFVDIESDCSFLLFPSDALKRKLNENFDRLARLFSIHHQLHLWVERTRVEVGATTSRGIGYAELGIKVDLSPLFVEEATQVEGSVVEVPVAVRHPEDSIASLADLVDTTNLLLHPLVGQNLALLVPHTGGVTPVTCPLGTCTPWVPQLNELLAIDYGDVEDRVGVTLDDSSG